MFLKSLFGVAPDHLDLYETALIHKSASKLDSQKKPVNNERLEYLGDAILGAVIAEFLYNRFPNQDEGFLTQMRSKLVNRSFLTDLTNQIGLNHYIRSNTNNTAENSHIYGDAFEAIIGALYLDKGYATTKLFITKKLLANYVDLNEVQHTNTNFKSQLIEWSQKSKQEINFETTEHVTGDSRNPSFITVITTNDDAIGKGAGSSKKESQQNASRKAIEYLKSINPESF
ncbi:ribonuclease III [Mangrovibacterium sp.]|uniref:ribonuclease III n=1 Tax=Mangrovibacterium sp. TaxID=1961364 RepID=UPI00356769FF